MKNVKFGLSYYNQELINKLRNNQFVNQKIIDRIQRYLDFAITNGYQPNSLTDGFELM